MTYRPDTEIIQRSKYVASDFITASIAFSIFNIFRFHILEAEGGCVSLGTYLLEGKMVAEQILVPLMILGVYWLSGYYNNPFGKSRLEEVATTFFSALINTTWIYLIFLINDNTGVRKINYEMIAILFSLLFCFSYSGRLIITSVTLRHFRLHQWTFRTLVVGDSAEARESLERLVSSSVREAIEVVGYVAVSGENSVGDELSFPETTDLIRICRERNIDQVIIALQKMDESKVLHLLHHLFSLNLPIKIAPDTMSFLTSNVKLKDIYGNPLVDLTKPAISESSKNIKRICDIAISAVAMVILSPIMLWAAMGVKRSSKGGVIYSQERIGRNNRPFRLYKFRTMNEDAEKEGPRLTTDNDERVTPFGRILRRYRIDELPQFWNVVRGDMSIVGPRPERACFIEQIVKEAPYYTLICQVRPGITSWGMVKYGYASSVKEMVERTRYDLIYLTNMSLYIDIKILIYTIRTVLRGEGK